MNILLMMILQQKEGNNADEHHSLRSPMTQKISRLTLNVGDSKLRMRLSFKCE